MAMVPSRWRLEGISHAELPVWVAVAADGEGELLMAVGLSDPSSIEAHARRHGAVTTQDSGSRAATQLREYLAGERVVFDLRTLALGSEFERQAWAALLEIPHGQTRSYAEQARMLGRPAAARAVGRANGRNPLPIVVPCHRVIGSDGALTGFAGGLALKRWLLQHEGVAVPSEAADAQLALF